MNDQCMPIDESGPWDQRGLSGRLVVLGITAGLVPVSFVGAPYPHELLLQHVPTLLAVVGFTILTFVGGMSRLSFACVIAFLWIHVFGARWIYSFVPYDAWFETISGSTLSECFGWQRNHYDRFVHFASGVLGVPPASELLQRSTGLRPLVAAVLAVSVVMTIGAIYEIIEWQLAVWLSPAQAEAYNGQQGDVWDPQKDLALALLGSLFSSVTICGWPTPVSRASKC